METNNTLSKWQSQMIVDAFQGGLVSYEEVKTFINDVSKEKKQAVLVFGANWCPDCQILAGLIKYYQKLDSINQAFTFLLINVENYEINMDLLLKLDPSAQLGIPRLFIFDIDRKIINLDRNDFFRTVRSMNENALIEYLNLFKNLKQPF